MTVIIDTREKARAIRKIISTFDRCGVPHVSSKLWVGDYARLDSQLTVIDRKQNLNELAGNICLSMQSGVLTSARLASTM